MYFHAERHDERSTILRNREMHVPRLDETNLVGHISGIHVRGKADKGLLLPIGTDESVDLESISIVHTLDGVLDVVLGGTGVHEEHQGVVLLNALHRRLGVQGSLDHGELVQTRTGGNRLAGVLGGTGKTKGLGPIKGRGGPDLPGAKGVGALKGGLAGVLGLLG